MTIRLDIGSGYRPYQPNDSSWVHLDANPNAPHVEYVADAAGPLPFGDGDLIELRAVDICEHVPYRRTLAMFREWRRIARTGAPLYVQTPDAETIMAAYIADSSTLVVDEFAALPPIVSAAWRLLGGLDDGRSAKGDDDWRAANVHLALFTPSSLRWYLAESGWAVDRLTVNAFPNICCHAYAI